MFKKNITKILGITLVTLKNIIEIAVFAFAILAMVYFISSHGLKKVSHKYTIHVTYIDGTTENIKFSYDAHPNDELILNEGCINSNMNNISFTCGARNFKVISHITE